MKKFLTVPLEARVTIIAFFALALSLSTGTGLERVAWKDNEQNIARRIQLDGEALAIKAKNDKPLPQSRPTKRR